MMYHSEKRLLDFLNRHRAGIFFWFVFVIILVVINISSSAIYNNFFNKNIADQSSSDSSFSDSNSSDCNVLGINLHGTIYTYIPKPNDASPLTDTDVVSSENVVTAIQNAEQDDSIKAILVEVDSPGGLPVAGEEIANALKLAKKPTVAVIRQTGASAAYWSISSAGKIFASKNSDVGSIGVTSSYTQNTDSTQKFIQLSVGKYKDTGNPDKTLTADERRGNKSKFII